MMSSQKMDRGGEDGKAFTESQLNSAKWAESFAWNARSVPSQYDPVQLKTRKTRISCSCIDWWNTRSNLFCCFFDCVSCYARNNVFDATDPEVWREQLQNSNPATPDSMKGLWWLKDNIAHEKLVTIFNDANFEGTFNEDGTDGYGSWNRPLQDNWSRDFSFFGHILAATSKSSGSKATGRMNFKDGICTTHTNGGRGLQIVYRINDDEWWKVHYDGNPGEEGEQDINYMYKWLKVLDKDGNKTMHWEEWETLATDPLPNKNCGASWFPLWPCCLGMEKSLENMVRPNKKQIIRFKH